MADLVFRHADCADGARIAIGPHAAKAELTSVSLKDFTKAYRSRAAGAFTRRGT